MRAKRLAQVFAQIVVLLVVAIPVANAQPAAAIARFKSDVAASFSAFAYEKPAAASTGPQAQSAVNTPLIQINSIRMYLDQMRLARSPTVDSSLSISLNGQQLPRQAHAPGSSHADGSWQGGGGGASAEQPDSFERWGVFVNGDNDIAKQSTVDTQTGFKTRTKNVTLGADYRFANNSVLGASVAFLRSDSDLNDGAGNQNAEGYGFSLFGSYVPIMNAYIDGIVNIGHNDYDGQRQSAAASYTNSTSGNQWGFAVSAGYAFNQGPLALTPYGRVEYVDAKVNGFTESGKIDEALTIGEQRVKATTLTLGGTASYAISTQWAVLLPYGRLEFQYLAQSSANDVTVQLASNVTSTPGQIRFLGRDKSFGNFAVGLTALFGHGFSAFFNYQQLFGKSDYADQLYTLGLRVEF